VLYTLTKSYKRSLFGICKKCVPKFAFLTCIKGTKRIPKKSTLPALVGGAAPVVATTKPLFIPIAGGVTNVATTPSIRATAKKLLEDIKRSTGKAPLGLSDKAKLEFYSTQAVAGTNYTLVYKINKDSYVCYKIYKPLPFTKMFPRITKQSDKKSLKKICRQCGIPNSDKNADFSTCNPYLKKKKPVIFNVHGQKMKNPLKKPKGNKKKKTWSLGIKMCNPNIKKADEMCRYYAETELGVGINNGYICEKKWYLLWDKGGRCVDGLDEAENLAAYSEVYGYSTTTLLLAFGFGSGLGALGYLLTKKKNDVKNLESKYLVEM